MTPLGIRTVECPLTLVLEHDGSDLVNHTQECHVLCMAAARTCEIHCATQCRIRHELINNTGLFLIVRAIFIRLLTLEINFRSFLNTRGLAASVRYGQFLHAYMSTWFV